MTALPKPSRTARKKAEQQTRKDRKSTEDKNKRIAKMRDGYRCRFPLCGCVKLKLRLEVSHDVHKGMSGNPSGDRSLPAGLITLCLHRHQDGIISRHKGTLRTRYLTDKGNNGPVAWDIDVDAFTRAVAPLPAMKIDQWMEVARERKVQVLEPLLSWQRDVLEILAQMDC